MGSSLVKELNEGGLKSNCDWVDSAGGISNELGRLTTRFPKSHDWPVRALQHRPPVQGAEVPLIEVGRGLVARGDGAELMELGEEIFEPCPSNQSCQGFR